MRARVIEALEAALTFGQGRGQRPSATMRGAERRLVATCTAPTATSTTASRRRAMFSFNSPLGACETCRGFGRVIGIDFGLVVPDETRRCAGARSARGRPANFKECQDDLVKYAKKRGIPLGHPVAQLTPEQRPGCWKASPSG